MGPVLGQPTGARAEKHDHGWRLCARSTTLRASRATPRDAPAGARPRPPITVILQCSRRSG